MVDFVHLHNHSEYSLLDGLSKVKTMVKRAKELNQKAVAITDHGSMYGVIYFYQACKEAGVKPIIGCEIYITPRSRLSKEAGVDKDYNHLILLAENNTGYKNLMKIVSRAHLEGYYYKPRTDLALLQEHHEGIICLSACVNGFVSDPLLNGKPEEAEKRAKKLAEIFGPDHFYLEIQKHIKVPPQEKLNPLLITLSKKLGLPLVATNDNHYVYNTDAQAQEILLCIQTQTTIDQPNRKLSMIDSPDFFMKSSEEMEQLFQEIPQAVTNTAKIADMCNVEITLGKWIMPKYNAPNDMTQDDYLKKLVLEGAVKRYGKMTPEIQERIDYELSIILKKGYATYFLTVADFVNWAKDHGISVGPGRGSAAGSVVSYVLNITDIDPFFFRLPFERFLNPLRPSAPDIDLDFADIRREEVIKYVTEKYGEDKVAQIITFGTMEARGSVRDVGRALGMPYAGPDRISKMIPPGWQGHAMTLDNALDQSPDLKRAYLQEEDTKKLIDLAKKIEGVVRHASVHAAGVVIADKPLTEYVPLQREPNGEKVVTQYDMYTVGEDGVGLLKMDFLGLRNLTIIEESLRFIKQNQDTVIDISKVPLDDKKTYELLSSSETTGIFQLESAGMRRYIKELKPTTIFDLMAMVALYRPGPMQNIPSFIARKHNPALITYPDDRLKDILANSYGILTFQDDVLLTTITLAGYTWLDADKFRKAMGKKIPSEMKKQKEKFIQGAVQNGLTQKRAEEIFELIAPFAGYGFNKCVIADTIVTDAYSGKQYAVGQLYRTNKQIHVLSLTDSYKLKPSPIISIQENGIKKVFEVITRRGLKIKATDNHPFLTIQGFKELKQLAVGERIGTARYAPLPQKKYNIADFRIVVLGYLLAEGNFCHPSGIYFYSTSQDEIDDFIYHAKQFENARISTNTSKAACSVYVGRLNKKKGNSLFNWIDQLNLLNKKATQKIIPDFIYQLDKEQLSIFLAKMWQGDGSITPQRGGQFFYATSSESLARQMQHLLLRLGIISVIHNKSFSYRGKTMPGFTVNISRYTNIKVFSETIGKYLIGDKVKALNEIIYNHPILSGKLDTVCARGSRDIIPAEILPVIQEEIYTTYQSLREYSSQSGIALRLLSYDVKKIGFLRESVQYMADSLHSQKLDAISHADVYWDEIVAINAIAKEMTYDLTIARTHNFVANDFIVHNSHAACYATIAFRTAYLKAHYPVEFMTALFTAESRGTTGPVKNEKIAQAVEECKRLGITVLPPDINASAADFTIESNAKIRFGLSAIKNVGEAAIRTILDARSSKPFSSFDDFCKRVELGAVNKKTLESLIKAGALDNFGNRALLLASMSETTEKITREKKQKADGQGSLFGDDDFGQQQVKNMHLDEDIPDFTDSEKLAFEKEFLGFYLTAHPQAENLQKIQSLISHELEMLETQTENVQVKVGGIVDTVKRIFTKKTNAEMAFVSISNAKGISVECVIFPRVFEAYRDLLFPDTVLVFEGKVDLKNDKPVIIVNEVRKI
ncbi:MAG TPA: DNA polymerase III subunit alpha [Patescibacteria group bacterium]|nr:DNA polymerase III subunit alpha [Patescibacteria group bacterium]